MNLKAKKKTSVYTFEVLTINKKPSLHIILRNFLITIYKEGNIMKNSYQQQVFELYMKQCGNLYPSRHIYPGQYVNMSGISNNTGFLRLNIHDQVEGTLIPNATITIYVTDGSNRDIPIMHLITTLNPIRLELPMAYELGTQIVGPEYSFSTYNLRVDAFGYFANNVYGIRLFPNITIDYEIGLIPVSHIQEPPVKLEERLETPPHPRDEPI